jgi:hypothetical protein
VRYTRIYAGDDGESHFEEVDIALDEVAYAPPAPPYFVSRPSAATAVVYTTIPRGWSSEWHPTPKLQWWFQLAGEVEVVTSDRDSRRFLTGSIVRVEDTTGQGHTTRVVGDADVIAVYVHISA